MRRKKHHAGDLCPMDSKSHRPGQYAEPRTTRPARRMTTKAAPQVQVSTCQLFSSEPMVCPLYKKTVPAWTQHACQQKEPK